LTNLTFLIMQSESELEFHLSNYFAGYLNENFYSDERKYQCKYFYSHVELLLTTEKKVKEKLLTMC